MIALDASAIIAQVEHFEPASRKICALVLMDDDRILSSTVALAECLTGPLRAGDRALYWRYLAFFDQPQVQMRDATRAIAEQTAVLRAEFRPRTPDALHLATAIDARARTSVTTDQADFSRCRGRLPIDIQIVARGSDPR